MMTEVRSWAKENSTLIYFLIGQAVIIVTALVSLSMAIASYRAETEARIKTLEVRGSPHLEEINRRLTVTESETKTNKLMLEQIKEVLLRDLHIQLKP
jgi:hypothetical protein